ncbi:MAG: aminopeptidase P family protein [Desulfobacterales bacterium]|nr:aminopeptidase P family protein [Desulfobacterales bacterium]
MEMSDLYTPGAELAGRVQRLKGHMAGSGVDGALILEKADLFYFSGSVQQAHLYIPVEGEPILMVRKDFDRAARESALERIVPLKSPGSIPDILKENGLPLPDALGMELDVLPTNLYFAHRDIFNGTRLKDVSHEIRLTRAVKSPYEIDAIRGAARLSDRLAGAFPGFLKEGITEIELAGKIEAEARKMGHMGLVRMRMWGGELFYGHLMAGPSAAEPSFLSSPTGGAAVCPAMGQGSGTRRIRPHEPVLFDYTFAFNGYISDSTRIFSIGALPDELSAGHEDMLEIQEMIRGAAKPGVKSGVLWDMAVKRVREMGHEERFMGADPRRVRFVGHGVGLELDEYPFLARGRDQLLEAGMVIAVEPKLIFPGKGVVGIENTFLVTDDGLERLTIRDDGVKALKVRCCAEIH